MVDGLDEQWQADLVDVQRLASENNGYRYWLTAIDILSRYAWIVPIKDKTGMDVVRAFQKIFREGRQPRVLQTDEGTEFLNHQFQGFLNSQNIRHFVVYSDPKAQIIEQFHRTIKNRLWRYFYLRGNERYLEVLPELVRGYNAAYHRTIGRSPDSVTMENAQEVWHTLYDDEMTTRQRSIPFKFKVGDRVRISKVARVFKKGYLPNWTEEVFVVAERMKGMPKRYKLKEWDGELIQGSFYERELQRVTTQDTFRIEAILDRRGRGARKEVLVKWRGWPDKYNSWILEKEMTE